MPQRTIHATLTSTAAEDSAFALSISPVLVDGARLGTRLPDQPDTDRSTFVPLCVGVTVDDGETEFELLTTTSVEDGVRYDLMLQGPGFRTAIIKGVRVPDVAEHADPLYLWQLIEDYATG